MQVRITGSANLSQAKAEFKALQAQVMGLNAAMAQGAAGPKVNPAGYRNLAGAIDEGSRAYRNAAASTGQFRVEQMRLNSATSHYTDLLQKQKLSFKDMRKHHGIMKAAYKEQLAQQQMMVEPAHAGRNVGKNMYDVITPNVIGKDLDTLNKQLEWNAARWKSAGTQMVNFGKNTQWAGRQLTVGFTMPLVALGVAAGVMAYQVDKELTRIQKVYDTTADQGDRTAAGIDKVAKEFQKLETDGRKTAAAAAREYGASMTDTLAVQAELAATGQTGNKLQSATTEVMKSATLGEIDYQTATSATIALQQQLHLSTTELTDSWAYMNSVENATSLQMKDFAQAIPIALGPIRLMGGDLQDLGTIMTSMVSRGVQVGKAANAIKAMPQRLSRPSKQIQKEFKAITGQDILELNKKNENNIIGLLTDIGDATEKLGKGQRRKALAGLFGSYQLAPMEAMIQGMNDLQSGVGQTSRAFDIANQSTKDWAQTSKQELKAQADSASGQFKRMYESLKVELANMGDPFLEFATKVGKGVVSIFKWFNELPKIAKNAVALPIVIAAMAGPILMLTGLMYNLLGNGVKAIGALMGMGKAMKIMTTEERAMMLAHKQEQSVMTSTLKQSELRVLQLGMLSKATDAATRSTMAFALAEKGVSAAAITKALGGEAAAMNVLTTSTQQANAALLERAALLRSRATTAPPGVARRLNEEHKQMVMPLAYAENDARKAQQSGVIATNTKKIAENTNEIGRGAKLAAVGTAAMAGGMLLTMTNSNEAANSMGQMLMVAGLVGPMFAGMGGHLKNIASRSMLAARNSRAMSAATNASAKGMWAFAAASWAALGPIGIAAAAVAAIGLGAYKLWKWDQKRKKDLREQNASLTSQKNLMSNMLNITPKAQKTASVALGTDVQGQPTAYDISKAMKEDKQAKKLIALYKNTDSEAEKATIASEKYMQVLRSTGGTAKKAERYVTAMYMAAGDGALEAEVKAARLMEKLGDSIDPVEMSRQWGALMSTVVNDGGEVDAAETRAKAIGAKISDAIARGARGSAGKILDGVDTQLSQQWNNIYMKMDSGLQKSFSKFGVDSADELQKAMKAFESAKPLENLKAEFDLGSMSEAQDMYTTISDMRMKWSNEIQNIGVIEDQIVKKLRTDLGLSKDIKTMAQLRATWEFKLLNVTKATAKETYLANLQGKDHMNELSKAQKLQFANQVMVNAGMGKAKTYQEAMVMLGIANANTLGAGANKAKELSNQLSNMDKDLLISLRFNKEEVLSVKKAGMEGVMNDMADAASETFDNRMNASLDASQRGWDARIEANDNAAEKATSRMDNKWERINHRSDRRWERRKDKTTAYYDRRIAAIDKTVKAEENAIKAEEKAEDIRQRIFEAEKTRMERLSEMANKNIDFNVAINTGNLDEAAKIRNDVAAQQADWSLSDSADSSQRGSDARIEAREARQDKLEGRKDKLEGQKDRALKQIERNEEAAKRSLARREKNEKAHLVKMQKARADSLRKQSEADMTAQRKRWEYDKKTLDNRLEMFKSYTGRNQKDLEAWMKKVGLSYDDFGKGVKKRGESWSQHWRNRMYWHMKAAAKKIQSDKMWAEMGKDSRLQMLKSMGFSSLREFRKFVNGGPLPSVGKSNKKRGKGATKSGSGAVRPLGSGSPQHHAGGFVGGKSSRVGVARTLKGLHSSEQLINAQKGEFVVNRRASEQNAPLLKAINEGKVSARANSSKNVGSGQDGPNNVGRGVGGASAAPFPASFNMAAMSAGFLAGIENAMQKVYTRKKAANAAASMQGGIFGAGKAGKYGDRSFNKNQLKNAATIASVGSNMGMSKRDIQIGIMTAITESGLVNIHGGDRDSQGLFQQRPSQGWGTVKQVTNPQYASRKFFSVLKGHKERNDESPWLAAQHVQRSAFSDGSNYRQYWDEAVSIMKHGLRKSGGKYSAASGFGALGGKGGKHRATTPGKGWSNSHDYRNGPGSPIYAIGNGRIIESRDITSGGSSGNGSRAPNGKPYRSYGRVVKMRTNSGVTMLAGHLSQRAHTGKVKGGAIIGRSGNTGNSTGPHTHFEVNGSTNAQGAFQRLGIGLDKGGYTTKDGMANLHKNEVVIDPNRTDSLYKGLDKFSSVMDSVKNVGTGTGGESLKGPFESISKLFSVGQQDRSKALPYSSGPLKKKAAPKKSSPSKGSSGSPSSGGAKKGIARIATFNVHAYGHKNARSVADLKRVMANSDAMALQENTSRRVRAWVQRQGWGMHKGPTGTAIAWRKSKFHAGRFGNWDLNKKYRMPKRTSQRYVPYGLLRDKQTKKAFWLGSAHLIPGHKYFRGKVSKAHRNAILNEQYQRMRMLRNKLDNVAPVVFGGDYNEGRAGRFKGMNVKEAGGRGNKGGIDKIYSGLRKSGKGWTMNNSGLASDHPAVFQNYKLPGLKTGGYTMNDGMAMLHKKELVLDAPRTKVLHEGIENLASGANNTYNLTMQIDGKNFNEDMLADRVIKKLKREEDRKPKSRKG